MPTVNTSELSLADDLRPLGACDEAVEWAADYTSPAAAWAACRRGDWMLWVWGRLEDSGPWGDGRKLLLLCCLECAETAKHLWPASHAEQMARHVATLRRWAAGEATVKEAKAAGDGLKDAAYDANRAYLASDDDASAQAKARAAGAAFSAVFAATDVVSVAAAVAAAAAVRAADAIGGTDDHAQDRVLAECADIVRKHRPEPPVAREG